MSFRPPIKCKDPGFGNPITCDLDDITSANETRTKNIWNMTPIKVVVGGPTISNEPPRAPEDEVDVVKTVAAKGSAKVLPDVAKD